LPIPSGLARDGTGKETGSEAMACFNVDSNKTTGAKQEMELNWTDLGEELVSAFIALALFGIIYNHGIQKFPWLASRRSAEQVVIGVSVTVLISGFVIGWLDVLVLAILFSASGLPMLIGSWVRAAKDDEQAKEIAREALKQ
jgi:hypothetical protein